MELTVSEYKKLMQRIAELEAALQEEVRNRDTAEEAADRLASAALGEPIDWPCHQVAWQNGWNATRVAQQRIAELEAEVERLEDDIHTCPRCYEPCTHCERCQGDKLTTATDELARVRDWLADRQLSLVTKGLLESADAIEQQINAINDTIKKLY